jgi:triacylglycerol lipase
VRVLDHLAPARRRLVLGVLGLLCAAVVAAALALVVPRLTSSDAEVDPVAQDAQPPVLLVPGYGGGTDALQPLADALRRAGRDVTIVELAGDGTGDLNVQAGVLQDAVRRVAGAGGSVDLIGYSAGGVVVRLWVARHDGVHLARRVVTLGAPLHGAQIAAVGSALVPGACPIACQQLVPGSALLTQLDGERLPRQLPWLSVWTESDETVTPPDSARLTGAVNVPLQSVCPDAQVSHGELPTDPLVTTLVLAALGTAPLTVPAACPGS